MDLFTSSALMLSSASSLRRLPEELLNILRSGSNAQYLDTISRLSLQPMYTSTIFTTHESISAELCSRWLPAPGTDDLAALTALASILPSFPYLAVYASSLLERRRGMLDHLGSREVTALKDLPLDVLRRLLLALYRLLKFDGETFALAVSVAQLQVLLRHQYPYIRYLAIRILCLYLHASDTALESMIESYIGEIEIPGPWEDKTIDYAAFSSWEMKRLKDLHLTLQGCRKEALNREQEKKKSLRPRLIETENFSETVACIGGVLVPRLKGKDIGLSTIVMTETTSKNMRSLMEGVKSSRPLLVTGVSGVGKSSMIREVARELGKESSMVTLHLNEQTDAKLLIGMYTSAKTSGSFTWRPGVLTTAVLEGRWVLVEDLDHAPTEIMSTLLPLLERQELLVPNWGKIIRASPGFQLIATVRSVTDFPGKEFTPKTGMIGLRHWLHVPFAMPPDEELSQIIVNQFPHLHAYVSQFMEVYRNLRDMTSSVSTLNVRSKSTRPIGTQDLLRWCRRVQVILSNAGTTSGNEPISDTVHDHILLEAVDCFTGAFPPGSQKSSCVDCIAQGLHVPGVRVDYCLNARMPTYSIGDSAIRIGRVKLAKQKRAPGSRPIQYSNGSRFATTDHVTRVLESVASAVERAEPCLLVGETGIGKTTIIQELANSMDQKLTVVNLSQQSEVGDLLGGYKPVNMRALAIPMKEEFEDLMALTFTSNRNQSYTDTLGKAVSKGRWEKALALWQGALRTIESQFNPPEPNVDDAIDEPQPKKRRFESPKFQKVKRRWNKFASDVQTFQMHLASGSKGFAFSFVEGNIVKAARNGEWVLLDEINLAPPDTLESLADLFSPTIDGGPSILLTESGDTERIIAHENFRMFSAMNPATDIGKRNLPVSLRSRFTELFIDAPDKDLENLVPLVKAYLGPHHAFDIQAATDVARLYLHIQALAADNRLVDGANSKAIFSLRTLTRTLIYALDIAPMYGLRRALFEGFSMSFLTILDRESELLLEPMIKNYILGGEKNSKAILHQTPRLPQDGKDYVRFKQYWIAQGPSPIEKQDHYIITPFIERNLLNLVRATSTRRFPVLLQGPTSSGKTSMIEYLARISGNKFIRINNHENTELQEYLGTYTSDFNGRLHFQEGILVQALREGHWVVLDELNLAPTDVLEALNRLLDDNKELLIPETQQVVRPHENFMLFATQNPPGIYGGRKVLSRAFRNRFLELHFDDIPEDELENILRERSQIAPSFCTRIVAVYKRLSILRQSERLFEQKNSFATLRDLFRWALRDADDREQLANNGFLLLAERVRNQEERTAVKSIIEEEMKVKIDEDKLYDIGKVRGIPGLENHSSQDIVWTKSMRRLGILVTEALKSNEPVLLVGETGSGKTTICQSIAEMMGNKLRIVNAHQNMETSDVIGAQRPVRNKTETESQLSQELVKVLRGCGFLMEDCAYELPELLRIYENLNPEVLASVSEQRCLAIKDYKTRINSLFEWADGSLVTAMREGEYFLLDEISLADDAVLERLNSVLEPGRTLVLAEKGTSDNSLKAAPDFQFLATMNPGGDYGKRELSPALRNRFTEIWVPNASSIEEMLEIVQAKIAPQLSSFATPMVKFAAWYSASFHSSGSQISIRDLLSWSQFINKFQHSDCNVAFLHGAAMVYIDGLGANPASKSSIAGAEVSEQRQACISKLDELFGRDLSSIYKAIDRTWSDGARFGIGCFSLAKTPSSALDFKYSLNAPTTMANALKLIRALQLSKPILIEGRPGVGKTTLVAALAHTIGMPLTRINLSDQTDLMDLFGSDIPIEGGEAGLFGWRDAPFLRAMQKGEWVLLDEMNLASQSVLEGLNACLDHRGQVYISELDRAFERHPNFVVFAAQNPHHQGGGRKGLPASFVNRFTVVYADTFITEDLMLITKEMFPSVLDETREQIVRSITSVGQMLQKDQNIGAHGGPWEINLRDVLRWLHLMSDHIGLVPLARPADFEQLLLLQRFRASEDVAAVSKVLRHNLPNVEPRNYFHGKCKGLVEVGMALLPRDSKKQPISGTAFDATKSNASLFESAMLCVQNNWPCLLVGTSGSGKSNLIFQLASSVGADILEIPMNSEMDTLDLIGGFEQKDPQRDFADLKQKIRDHVHRVMTWELGIGVKLSEDMTRLEAQLRDPKADAEEIMQTVVGVSREMCRAAFDDFFVDAGDILSQNRLDNRARFEWVDGMLIKALKQGKWVILDNANLCNPAVLDRLNSLLEPDGFLSINEHRSLDGSAPVIRPHKDFRLFMTMDPRHGELSRAMRNRSIELFIPAENQSPSIELLGSSSEPSVSRFATFQGFDLNALDDDILKHTLNILFDHLAFSDFKLKEFRRWEAQIKNGLVDLSHTKQSMFALVLESYLFMFSGDSQILRGIFHTYKNIEDDLYISAPGFASIQTIHPLNNPHLLPSTDKNPPSCNLRHLGRCFELLLEIYSNLMELISIDQRLFSDDGTSSWSCLERSMVSLRTGGSKKDTNPPIASFLQEMAQHLRFSINTESLFDDEDQEDALTYIQEVLTYVRDVFFLAKSPDINEGEFQVYQAIGRAICTPGRSSGATKSLVRNLSSELDKFNVTWQLSSGFGMSSLWSVFRPKTAIDLYQLEFSLRAKGLADQFDDRKFSSVASLQELEGLQRSIVRIHDFNENPHLQRTNSLNEVQEALEGLQRGSVLLKSRTMPFFQNQFEMLYQYKARTDGNRSNADLLYLLAARPTRELMSFGASSEAWKGLSQIQGTKHPSDNVLDLSAIREILPVSMLQKLGSINEVPLHSLGLLCTEMNIAAKVVATSLDAIQEKPLDDLRRLLQQIQHDVCRALESVDLADIKSSVDRLWKRFRKQTKDQSSSDKQIEYLRRCLHCTTNSQHFGYPSTPDLLHEEYARVAFRCSQFFIGCLLLFVPDRPFDPVLRPMVDRTRQNRRKAELENKLRALRYFEVAFSGQTSSLRIQLAEEGLQALGAELQAPSIVRPQDSGLADLQIEFNNILSTIVLRAPDLEMLQATSKLSVSQTENVTFTRANIAQAIKRLSQSFFAYQDITEPLIAMLQGLDAGLALVLFASARQDSRHEGTNHISKMTPLLGTDPLSCINAASIDLQPLQKGQEDDRLHFLSSFAVCQSVNQHQTFQAREKMLDIFNSLYEDWKEQLIQEKEDLANQSSLYRYRGGEPDTEAEEEELRQLFPTFGNSTEERDRQATGKPEPKYLARIVAQLQRDIFQTSHPTSARILSLLQDGSQRIAEHWQDQSGMSTSSVPAAEMLSALILSLHENKERLDGGALSGQSYNFYTDANLREARKLVHLIHKIQRRFVELQEVWPEHATLGDVLRTSSELLALRHSEPIAKLLTKTEQLHGYVYEWQTVASKQYTAIEIYDELTSLIVSWRRFELCTWARLLDAEDGKCSDDADAWWFIAYEVIVAAPLSLVNNEGPIGSYAEQLFSTLSGFLASTSMGQYVHRLGMISCFEKYVEVLEKHCPGMNVIRSTIANFINHYSRFNDPIQQNLRKGRQSLEKDVKEIVLLASWKDTNINALRDSAKRSHHKLFKLIRRYRTLLAQPSSIVLDQGLPWKTVTSGPDSSIYQPAEAGVVDERALDICRARLKDWKAKPQRLTNILTTSRMRSMGQLLPSAIDFTSYLTSFGSDLIESIKLLRDETPVQATENNVGLVKHLKVRKRKLFTDTLKAIRQMGFRSSVGADALVVQESLAKILSNSPFITESPCKDHLVAAESSFHYLLNNLPLARDRARNHSEDLTHSEAARSLGYLESMVSMILRQRSVLATEIRGLESLLKKTTQLQNLWALSSHSMTKLETSKVERIKGMQHVLNWLPSILEASAIIIDKQSQLSGTDSSVILERINTWKAKLIASRKTYEALPELPDILTSSRHEEVFIEGERLLQHLSTDLDLLIDGSPDLNFIFRKIKKWTDPPPIPLDRVEKDEEHYEIETLDSSVLSISDRILVSLQRMQKAYSSITVSTQDPQWLVRAEVCLADGLKSLHVQKLNKMLDDMVTGIKHLEPNGVDDFQLAGALCAVAMPIIQQYYHIHEVAISRYLGFHRSMCELASLLLRTFSEIALNGFCSPAETSGAEAGDSEKLEGGTGLGEGDGAEDISKDIQDDEDMSELARNKNNVMNKEELESQEDAVDMDHDDLEGELGEGSEKGNDDGSADEGSEDNIDEETGSVDDLDPSAVDEKLWDGKAEENEKEKSGLKSKGNTEKDEQIAADAAAQKETTEKNEGGEEEQINEEGAEEGEEIAEEAEQMDPDAQEGQNLDLPEEMDLESRDGTEGEVESRDSVMDGMSDVDQGQTNDEDMRQQNIDESLDQGADTEHLEDKGGESVDLEAKDSPVDTEPSDDDDQAEDDHELLRDRSDNAAIDQDNAVPSDVKGLGEDMGQENDGEQAPSSKAQASKGEMRNTSDQDDTDALAKDGQSGAGKGQSEFGQSQDRPPADKTSSQAFKRLGDTLEKWHRQNKEIQDATDQNVGTQDETKDVDMADQDFEHLQDEDAEGQTQALGAATDEQARALDDQALDSEMAGETRDFPPEQAKLEGATDDNEVMNDVDAIVDGSEAREKQSWPSALVTNGTDARHEHDQNTVDLENAVDVTDSDIDLPSTRGQSPDNSPHSADEARRLWLHYESHTRDLSLVLTEQLRLILAPTLATKMRGDFRTGKRLNIKRIIPYIASQYKRDKIWMRRSIPSKRNYQIMLAVDDSKSMGESGSGQLAFETLALVAKSLSMLEVGEICVVGFGNEVHVAHEFNQPFSSEAGIQILQRFSFQQTKTNVRRLVAESISLFREAKSKTFNAGTDLWQLELIISDGVCEDHDTTRRLVRQAQEERIMVIFVIVDTMLKGESIVDMKEAVFEPDGSGESKLKLKRYLDGFPFPYYLVVGDVRDLPGVLAQALRQWFAEVVESG